MPSWDGCEGSLTCCPVHRKARTNFGSSARPAPRLWDLWRVSLAL